MFSELNCKTVADKLRNQLDTLSELKYNNMKISLISRSVITDQEAQEIDAKIGKEKMTHLTVCIIIPSLKQGNSEKYKGFLEAMEKSEDGDLRHMAKKLGKFN